MDGVWSQGTQHQQTLLTGQQTQQRTLAGHLRRHHLGLHFGGSVIGSCGPLQGAPRGPCTTRPGSLHFPHVSGMFPKQMWSTKIGCISKCSSVLNSINNAKRNSNIPKLCIWTQSYPMLPPEFSWRSWRVLVAFCSHPSHL